MPPSPARHGPAPRIALLLTSAALLGGACALPVVADSSGQPQPGWYVAAPDKEEATHNRAAPSMALKVERRGAAYQITGVFGDPHNTKTQSKLRGNYRPKDHHLSGNWVMRPRYAAPRDKPLDGTYNAAENAFDVDLFTDRPRHFHCVGKKPKHEDPMAGIPPELRGSFEPMSKADEAAIKANLKESVQGRRRK